MKETHIAAIDRISALLWIGENYGFTSEGLRGVTIMVGKLEQPDGEIRLAVKEGPHIRTLAVFEHPARAAAFVHALDILTDDIATAIRHHTTKPTDDHDPKPHDGPRDQ
ncbi:MAG TPA: hypothetical protein VJ247_08320 [Gaiella sp.]|jgi:hypothetical protein|nr:hypothetical protein [Gaiella sp.]